MRRLSTRFARNLYRMQLKSLHRNGDATTTHSRRICNACGKQKPRPYPHPMIDLGTIAGLHAHDHQLAAYCPRCDAWQLLTLAEMVVQGKGSLRLPIRLRCGDCGEVGQLQVRPPTPMRSSSGWIDRTQACRRYGCRSKARPMI
jgi:hypothetical protein